MPALNPQDLLEDSKCYACLGVSLYEQLRLALLNSIVANSGAGCGEATDYIFISGAGDADANGLYTWDGINFTKSNLYYISTSSNPPTLFDPLDTALYEMTGDFPCGTWTTVGAGAGTAPSGQYTGVCGYETDCLMVSGASVAGANGVYFGVSATQYTKADNSYTIQYILGVWSLGPPSPPAPFFDTYYDLPFGEFPCGAWRANSASPPAPTVAYWPCPAYDDLEGYTAGNDLDGLNLGTDWGDAYASRAIPDPSYDDMQTYSAGASLNGLNDGTNWDAAYSSR